MHPAAVFVFERGRQHYNFRALFGRSPEQLQRNSNSKLVSGIVKTSSQKQPSKHPTEVIGEDGRSRHLKRNMRFQTMLFRTFHGNVKRCTASDGDIKGLNTEACNEE